MPKFCAVISKGDPVDELIRMGGTPVHADGSFALGTLVDASIGGGSASSTPVGLKPSPEQAGRPGGLIAVGDSTILNRGELQAFLTRMNLRPPNDQTDAELLLRLYAAAGPDALAQVRGMFSLAIWNGTALYIASDPFGARTVFYTRSDGCFAAASSLRAIRSWPRLSPELNPSAVRSFLSMGYLPGEETLVKGVFKLLPASVLRVGLDRGLDLRTYWTPAEGPWDEISPREAYAAHLRELLEAAVRECLPKERSVGVFLSGGIDSSLVAALAAKLHDQPVKTFTASFTPSGYTEAPYASLVAEHCGVQSHELTFTGDDVAGHFAETIKRMECPVGEGLTVPNILLSRAAAEHGVDVILNGEGGDPCFGGPKNIPMLMFEYHRTAPDPAARVAAYLQAHRHCYNDLQVLLTPDFQRRLDEEPPLELRLQPYLEAPHMRYFLNKLMFTNLRLKGPGFMLTKVEFLTPVYGVQGRCPLFDKRVVDYSFAIPPSYKLFGTREKWTLKLAVSDLLPAEIILRPKSGMRMPMRHWLKGPLKRLADQYLLDGRGRARGIFQTGVIRSWLAGQGLTADRYAQRVWLLITLEAWLRSFLDCVELPEYQPEKPQRWLFLRR